MRYKDSIFSVWPERAFFFSSWTLNNCHKEERSARSLPLNATDWICVHLRQKSNHEQKLLYSLYAKFFQKLCRDSQIWSLHIIILTIPILKFYFIFSLWSYKWLFQLNSYKTFVLIISVKKKKTGPPSFHCAFFLSLRFSHRGSCAIFWCAHYLDILYFCIVYEILSCWLYHQYESEVKEFPLLNRFLLVAKINE